MLAGVALIMCAVVLIKMKRDRYVWVALVPAVGVLLVTCYAGLQKLFHNDPRASFLTHAGKYSDALAKNEVLAPAKDIGEMAQIIFNDKINAGLTILFLSVVVTVAAYGLRTALKARKVGLPTAKEIPAVYRDGKQPEEQSEA